MSENIRGRAYPYAIEGYPLDLVPDLFNACARVPYYTLQIMYSLGYKKAIDAIS